MFTALIHRKDFQIRWGVIDVVRFGRTRLTLFGRLVIVTVNGCHRLDTFLRLSELAALETFLYPYHVDFS